MEDLEPFYPDRMAGRILGMGDVLSFVEKAQEVVRAMFLLCFSFFSWMIKNSFDFHQMVYRCAKKMLKSCKKRS